MQKLDKFKRRNKRPIKKYKGLIGWGLAWALTIFIGMAGMTAITAIICKSVWQLF